MQYSGGVWGMRRNHALRSGLLLAAVEACGPIAACSHLETDVAQPISHVKLSWMASVMEAVGDTARPEDRAPAEVGPRSEAQQAEVDALLREAKRLIANLAQRAGLTELRDHSLASSTTGLGDTRYFVQIGSHQALSGAEGQLEMTRLRLGPALENFEMRVRPIQLSDQQRFFRVQIGPLPTQAAAAGLCRSLKAHNQGCFALADKPQGHASSQQRAEVPGGWASIERADSRFAMGKRDAGAPGAGAAEQIAESLPLYTAPGLPGVLQ
jgi:hypothetical protein